MRTIPKNDDDLQVSSIIAELKNEYQAAPLAGDLADVLDEELVLDRWDGFSVRSFYQPKTIFGRGAETRCRSGLKLNNGDLVEVGKMIVAGHSNHQIALKTDIKYKRVAKLRQILRTVAAVDIPDHTNALIDLTGHRCGLWFVLGRSSRRRAGRGACDSWMCRCACGTERAVRRDNLTGGRSTGCGCARGKQ